MAVPRAWWRRLIRRAPKPDRLPNRGSGSRPPVRRSGMGLLLLAIGRREGLAEFGNTPDAYLASLAPLIAFALVSCVAAAATGAPRMAAQWFFLVLCSWLAPAVISHPLCRRWQATAYWPRYVNILNWAQFLMFLVILAVSAAARAAMAAGLPPSSAVLAVGIAVLVYAVWFHWFVARGTLQLSRWRTVLLLLAVVAGTNLIVSVPLIVTGSKLPAFTVL